MGIWGVPRNIVTSPLHTVKVIVQLRLDHSRLIVERREYDESAFADNQSFVGPTRENREHYARTTQCLE